ncbi:MAG: hypothetical protein IJV38_08125 [Prevotella sp.]|nr:hypothetical protein [Prevotella sp.]
MKILKYAFFALCAFVIFFAPVSDFEIIGYFVIAPLCGLVAYAIFRPIIWWYYPQEFCPNWPYMFDKQRKKYLEQQKQKRNYYRKKFHFGTLEK